MGKVFDEIDDRMREWISRQHMFFVATAPSGDGGHVNLSPKGGRGLFRVTGPLGFAYVDLMGSGIETIAHLRENGRITLMVCAFSGPPQIIRLYGRGEVLRRGDEGYDELAGLFPDLPGARAVIRVALERVGSSCGYAVPFMRYEGERSRLDEWAEARGPEGLVEYRATKNAVSIDGLPGLDPERVSR
jgi:hypothetical protein